MAIVDANMVMDMPKSLVAAGGIDAIVHAIEAYVSVVANEFSDGQALTALKLLKEYLPASCRNGASDPVAREKVHNAATIAGIAFANSFLGVCHSMAHKIGSRFHIPHGIANGLLISNVIRYNAEDGRKMTAFSQYGRPQSKKRYVQIARHLGFDVSRDIDGVNELIEWIDETKRLLEIPKSIKDYGIDEAEFMASVDELAMRCLRVLMSSLSTAESASQARSLWMAPDSCTVLGSAQTASTGTDTANCSPLRSVIMPRTAWVEVVRRERMSPSWRSLSGSITWIQASRRISPANAMPMKKTRVRKRHG